MGEEGRYEKKPRPDSIKYFLNAIGRHDKVQKIEQIEEQLFKISKTNGRNISVHLTNIYIVSEAEVIDIMSGHDHIDAIVTISNWNSYSESGKEIAKANKIGLFLMNEFMGALNFEGNFFIDYLTPWQREQLKKGKRSLF
ncbi:hypothetical protein [Sporosarcina newyorkensis]|uniref:Uncharacterized protein n=1 Tax=Sporosarcina newyorkensis TaxID=759851 RepID=A0A1T4YHL9_9BACL|nr:hypothetical protein [Sporosarcina newyorkensis]SKB01327.1 hypothetical protein SAMN04244570_2678 [Sporosarcina newyorkensis]